MTPEQRAQFISNIVDADARRDAEKLWQASHTAGQAYAEACVIKGVGVAIGDRIHKTTDQIEAEFSANVAADPELAALRDIADDALAAWKACKAYGEPIDTDSGEIIRCALTGFIVHENDHYLFDIRTHELVLKAALGVALRVDGFDQAVELPIAEAVS